MVTPILIAPNVCGSCLCGPPSGSCGLPATLTASSTECPGTAPGAVHTAFDPPPGWDGDCTSNDSVPAGQLCAGGPCVQSVTIAPLTVMEEGCAPAQLPIPKDTTASWGTTVRVCRGGSLSGCDGNGYCTPPAPPGFRYCVFRDGDRDCTDPSFGPYTEKHVFYEGFTDTRSCSPCTCGPPAGSTCTAQISIHADAACSSLPLDAHLMDSSAPACVDVIAGSALGSKSASPPTYTPGACQPSGGEPMGSAVPVGPSTLCCIPSP
ncbi:MAG: hypothetical protein QM820_04210 [Minicystis sp.]